MDATFEALSELAKTTYQSLLQMPGFVTYFSQASPVEELANLKIGSRPARRLGAQTLNDLRAIPWVFAWSQNRHLITGWYGLAAQSQHSGVFVAVQEMIFCANYIANQNSFDWSWMR